MPDEMTNAKSAAPLEAQTGLDEKIEWVIGVVRRRRWWILSASCCIPIAVVAVTMQLPDKYVSRATVLVVQQQVSQRYVEPDSTTTPREAVQTLEFEVLSSQRLLSIINDFGLYPTDRAKLSPDLLADRIRKDIDIEPLESSNAFTIAFAAASPELARDVTGRLTSLFIEENSRTRGEQAANTAKFLSEQLDAAKQRLADQEQRLEAFKASHDGELPEQQQQNLMALGEARARLASVDTRLSQLQQQQRVIEDSLVDRLARLQSDRADLLKTFTARHPEVIRKDRQISDLQSVLDRIRTGNIAAGLSFPDDPVVAENIRQAQANAAEIQAVTKQQQDLKALGDSYQARLNLVPVREQQLQQIHRDYDTNGKDYEDLEKKQMESRLTATLEQDQQGQHFRLVDAPTLPVTPSSPKRMKICLGGLVGGLAFGIGLAFFVDLRKHVFYNERSLVEEFAVPLALSIPLVRTPSERRARVGRLAGEWVLGLMMTLLALAAELYVYRKG